MALPPQQPTSLSEIAPKRLFVIPLDDNTVVIAEDLVPVRDPELLEPGHRIRQGLRLLNLEPRDLEPAHPRVVENAVPQGSVDALEGFERGIL